MGVEFLNGSAGPLANRRTRSLIINPQVLFKAMSFIFSRSQGTREQGENKWNADIIP